MMDPARRCLKRREAIKQGQKAQAFPLKRKGFFKKRQLEINSTGTEITVASIRVVTLFCVCDTHPT